MAGNHRSTGRQRHEEEEEGRREGGGKFISTVLKGKWRLDPIGISMQLWELLHQKKHARSTNDVIILYNTISFASPSFKEMVTPGSH